MRIDFQIWRDGSAATLRAQLAALLSALVALNLEAIAKIPGLPDVYASGVRYRAESLGSERWRDIPTILACRPLVADCEDLACWRVAFLRARGVRAVPGILIAERPAGRGIARMVHIYVRLPDGQYEDPSVRLGMPPIPARYYQEQG